MKIPKPKKTKTKPLKRLREKADTLFSRACFKYWGNKCQCCGKEATATHHFMAKSISAFLRYNIQNGTPLCYHCHRTRFHDLADPRAIEAVIKNRGQAWYEELKKLKVEGETKGGFMGVGYYKDKINNFKVYLND